MSDVPYGLVFLLNFVPAPTTLKNLLRYKLHYHYTKQVEVFVHMILKPGLSALFGWENMA